ncbi:MAG: DNA replication/repair protein RecF [Clostridia bacterium]|nr:DNA replication/repair protein RecF [Clostridia bacterium]
MLIKELELVNYTNYAHEHISFHPRLNILIGANAQGKSNLIDSIHFLSLARSHRQNQDLDLIRWGETFFRLKGLIENKQGSFILEHAVKKGRKIAKINGTSLPKLSSLIGHFTTIIFTPDDLNLIKGGPELRRRFLNRKLVQLTPLYYDYSAAYQRILTQRNNLLKRGDASTEEMAVWDQQLSYYGSLIMVQRNKVLLQLAPIAREIHHQLSGSREVLSIHYQPNLPIENMGSQPEIQELLQSKLSEALRRDLRNGYTSVGPHRDDFCCLLNDVDARHYGSQGQQRTTVLTLKLAMLKLMAEETGEYPVLLLDDVFSELDQSRRQYLLAMVSQSVQTIITATDLEQLDRPGMPEACVFQVHQGKIN